MYVYCIYVCDPSSPDIFFRIKKKRQKVNKSNCKTVDKIDERDEQDQKINPRHVHSVTYGWMCSVYNVHAGFGSYFILLTSQI